MEYCSWRSAGFALALCGLLLASACAGRERPDPRADAVLDLAQSKLSSGDAEGALNELDRADAFLSEIARSQRGEILLLKGRANLTLARQGIASKSSASMIQGCLEDAASSLEAAVKTLPDSIKAPLLLAEVEKQRGKDAQITAAATEAIHRLQKRAASAKAGARPDPRLATALLARADAELRRLATRRQAEGKEISDASRSSAQRILVDTALAQRIEAKEARSYTIASLTHRWIGQEEEALATLAAGVRKNPEDFALHQALQSLYISKGRSLELLGFYKRLDKELAVPSAAVAWSLGQSQLFAADALRKKGDNQGADRRYSEASSSFAQCAERRKDYATSCTLKRAIATMSRARMAIEDGKEEIGEKLLDEAFALSPQIAEKTPEGYAKYSDGLRRTYEGAVYALGRRFMSSGGSRLYRAVAYWRKFTRRHPSWGPAWNNLGLAARDWGVRIARSGAKQDAQKLYEESYRAYEHAVQHSPDDPRIVNDCGLMLVYHLKRDYGKANRYFKRAIEIGTPLLEELGPKKADEAEDVAAKRRDLEEAVGDAWQNLAVSAEATGGEAKAIRRYCTQAIRYYPYQRRSAAAILKKLDAGKDEAKAPSAPPGKGWPAPSALCAIDASIDNEGLCTTEAPLDKIKEAIAKLEAKDPEGALGIIEDVLEDDSKDVELWFVAGRASLEYAKLAMAQRRSGVQANLIDAVDRLVNADKLTRELSGASKHFGNAIHVLPVLDLIEAQRLLRKDEEGWKAGERHLRHLDSVGLDFHPALLGQLMLRTASAGARVAIQAREQKKPRPKVEESVRERFTTALDQLERAVKKEKVKDCTGLGKKLGAPLDLMTALRTVKNLEIWCKRAPAAMAVLARGAGLLPEAEAGVAAGEIIGVAKQHGGTARAVEQIAGLCKARKHPPILMWYLAFAEMERGNALRIEGKPSGSPQHYDQAAKHFTLLAEKEPRYANNCRYYSALCQASKAWVAYDASSKEKDKRNAVELFLESIRTAPAAAVAKDALSRSARDGVLSFAIGLAQKRRELDGAKVMARLSALLPRDHEVLNNLGLMLRDAAGRLRGKRMAAKRLDLYEQSYAAYKKAVDLNPGDVRLLNDTALVDVYYIKRHAKTSEAMFRDAIRRGTAVLKHQTPKDSTAKRQLEEAVGDAHMNLGYMLLNDKERWDEAQKELELSMDFYPYRRRASGMHLARLAQQRKQAKKKEATESKKDASDDGGKH